MLILVILAAIIIIVYYAHIKSKATNHETLYRKLYV